MDGFRARPRDIGSRRARELAKRFGQELRIARVTSGLTQARVAAIARVAQSMVAEAEAGRVGISLEVRCRLAAAAGHELSIKLFPVETLRLRDSGQLAIAQAIVSAADPRWKSRLEVPTGPGPLHAADLVLERPDQLVQIEIERSLVDFQAQFRAAGLKRTSLTGRDARPVWLVIAVPETRAPHARLANHRELLQQALPTSSRDIWAALRRYRPIGGDGLIFVRAKPSSTSS